MKELSAEVLGKKRPGTEGITGEQCGIVSDGGKPGGGM